MKLHIGNLPKTLTEGELKDLITPFAAEPTSVEIVKDSAGTSRGYAFVVITDEQAKAVTTGLDGKEVGGQTLKVGEARPRKGEAPRVTA